MSRENSPYIHHLSLSLHHFYSWTQLKEWKLLSALLKNLEQNELYLTHGFHNLKVPFPGTPWSPSASQALYCTDIQENQVQTSFNDFNYKGRSFMLFTVENYKIKYDEPREQPLHPSSIIELTSFLQLNSVERMKAFECIVEKSRRKNLEQNELYFQSQTHH